MWGKCGFDSHCEQPIKPESVMAKLPKTKTLELDVDPYQGAAAMAASIKMPGYRFSSMERKGPKVLVTFVRISG